MKRQTAEPIALSQEAQAGPIKNTRPGELTTIWRDGEVWREDQFGRAKRLGNAAAVREVKP